MKINFKAKTATVTMKPGKSLSLEACKEAFKGTAYDVASLK